MRKLEFKIKFAISIIIWCCVAACCAEVLALEPSKPDLKSRHAAPTNKLNYANLLGKSSDEALNYLIKEVESSPPALSIAEYKNYITAERIVLDHVDDFLELKLKNNKVMMVRDRINYGSGNGAVDTKWYDMHGIVSPQPIMEKHEEEPIKRFSYEMGMDKEAYYLLMAAAINKKFHSASQCADMAIMIEIKPDGSVESAKLEHSSGNSEIDQEALKVIRSTKFASLSGGYKTRNLKVGIKVKGFLMQLQT